MRFNIDWDSLIVGRKFTCFALFYFVFESNFLVQAPKGLIFGGAIQRRVFCFKRLGVLYLEGRIFGILRYFHFFSFLFSSSSVSTLNSRSFLHLYNLKVKCPLLKAKRICPLILG